MVGLKDYMKYFNPNKDYVTIQSFMIIRRFEALCIIFVKDYTHVILGRDEGLHVFLQPFEGLFYNPSKVLLIDCDQGLHDPSTG